MEEMLIEGIYQYVRENKKDIKKLWQLEKENTAEIEKQNTFMEQEEKECLLFMVVMILKIILIEWEILKQN